MEQTKKERLYELYLRLEEAKKANPLLTLSQRQKRLQELKTIKISEEDKDKPCSMEVIADIQRASRQMWAEYEEYNKPAQKIMDEIESLTNPISPKVTAIEKDDNGWNVRIEDKGTDFAAWLSVVDLGDEGDLEADWARDIFYLADPDEVYQYLHQENIHMSEACIALAIDEVYETLH